MDLDEARPEDLDRLLEEMEAAERAAAAAAAAAQQPPAAAGQQPPAAAAMTFTELLHDAIAGADMDSSVLEPGYVPAPLQRAAPALLGRGAGTSGQFDIRALATAAVATNEQLPPQPLQQQPQAQPLGMQLPPGLPAGTQVVLGPRGEVLAYHLPAGTTPPPAAGAGSSAADQGGA